MEEDMGPKDWAAVLAYLFWMPFLVLTALSIYVTLSIE